MEKEAKIDYIAKADNLKERGVSKGELQALMPKVCVDALQKFMNVAQHVLRDGVVTYGEHQRLLQQMHVMNTVISESKRLNRLRARGQKLSAKKPGLERALTPDVPDVQAVAGTEATTTEVPEFEF